MQLETERLILRPFEARDMGALFELLRDEEVNTFLPWFPVRSLDETAAFYERRFKDSEYAFAICLKADDTPIGYNQGGFGREPRHGLCPRTAVLALRLYARGRRGADRAAPARRRALRHRDARPEQSPSGHVMRALGMRYCYSYEEQWQPKDFPVVFRLYQLNLDGRTRVYRAYWEQSKKRFIESDL